MNLNTSDQRLKKNTVSVSNDVLKKLQRSVNKKINNLRAQGKLTKASLPTIICLFALSLFEVQAVTTFTESFEMTMPIGEIQHQNLQFGLKVVVLTVVVT